MHAKEIIPEGTAFSSIEEAMSIAPSSSPCYIKHLPRLALMYIDNAGNLLSKTTYEVRRLIESGTDGF